MEKDDKGDAASTADYTQEPENGSPAQACGEAATKDRSYGLLYKNMNGNISFVQYDHCTHRAKQRSYIIYPHLPIKLSWQTNTTQWIIPTLVPRSAGSYISANVAAPMEITALEL